MDNLNLYSDATVEKVKRLLELMSEIQAHPALKGKLVMHGGTAINLFMFDVPRLSVDIDLSYVGSRDREQMLQDKPIIEKAIYSVCDSLNYDIRMSPPEHAGRTFKLSYKYNGINDSVKIDCIYMNRSSILPLAQRECKFLSGYKVWTFDDLELIGGKVHAFYSRVKIRDLYDLSNIYKFLEAKTDKTALAHKIILFYASISSCFPFGIEDRGISRFSNLDSELENELLPMLQKGSRVCLDELVDNSQKFISSYVLPQDEYESEYLQNLANGIYKPELLFKNDKIVKSCLAHPEALWKVRNIKKML